LLAANCKNALLALHFRASPARQRAGKKAEIAGGELSSRNVLDCLNTLAEEPDGLSLTELAKRLGTSVATVSRTASTLREAGFLSRREESKTYTLGPKLLELGVSVLRRFPVAELALIPMGEAARATRRNVYLGVPLDDRVLFLHGVSLVGDVLVSSPIGHSMPLHATAGGKSILAFLPDLQIRRICGTGLESFTPQTIDDTAELRSDLANIRSQGFAEACEEFAAGICAIAVPVFDNSRRVNATVAFGFLPSAEHTPALTSELLPFLQKCASEISWRLGYVPGIAGRLS
jgi:DNA-binding IclR family transcriptional regulator